MLTIEVAGVTIAERELANMEGMAERAAASAAQKAFDHAQDSADRHTKTGALARSATLRSIADGFEVYHDQQIAPHAAFVHFGSRPHAILPKEKKALRWVEGTQFVFARFVRHPGYKGDPWMIAAGDKAIDEFERFIDEETKKG